MTTRSCSPGSFPSLSAIRDSHALWHSPVENPVHTPDAHSHDVRLRCLHAAVSALRETDLEAYITAGESIRPLRMARLYDRLIALNRDLSGVSGTLTAMQLLHRQELERQQDSDWRQPRESPRGDAPASSPRSVQHCVCDLVKNDALLREWVTSADHMRDVVDLAILLCQLMHREGRESGFCGTPTSVFWKPRCDVDSPRSDMLDRSLRTFTSGTDVDDANMNTNSSNVGDRDGCASLPLLHLNRHSRVTNKDSPSEARSLNKTDARSGAAPTSATDTESVVTTVPWFSLSSLLSKLLLLTEACVLVVRGDTALRAALMPSCLQLISIVLATCPTGALGSRMDPCHLQSRDNTKTERDVSSSSSSSSSCSAFCFSSALRTDALQVTRSLLLTNAALPDWQEARMLHAIIDQLRAPATETGVYEQAILTLSEYALNHTDKTTATAVLAVNALLPMLQRPDPPTTGRGASPTPPPASASGKTTAANSVAAAPYVSPFPDGGLLLPSPLSTALQLPHYIGSPPPQQPQPTGTGTTTRNTASPTGTVVASMHTAVVEVSQARTANIVSAASPTVNWRTAVIHGGHDHSDDGGGGGDDDDEVGALLQTSLLLTEVLPSMTMATEHSLPRVVASETTMRAAAAAADGDADDDGVAISTTVMPGAVSSETIMREWYQRFQAPVMRSAEWPRGRRGSLLCTPPPCLHVRVSSHPCAEAANDATAAAFSTPAPMPASSSSPARGAEPSPSNSPGLSPMPRREDARRLATSPPSAASSPAPCLTWGVASVDARRPLYGQLPFLPLPPTRTEDVADADVEPTTTTLLYPSHLALRLSVVRCLQLWLLPRMPCGGAEATDCRPAHDTLEQTLTVLCETRAVEALVSELQQSISKAERPLRAALRRVLCEAVFHTTDALRQRRTHQDDGAVAVQPLLATVGIGFAELLAACLPLIQPTPFVGSSTRATSQLSASGGHCLQGAAASKRLRGTVASLESSEADTQLYELVHTALAALVPLMPELSQSATASTPSSSSSSARSPSLSLPLHALVQKLVPLTLRCLTTTNATSRSGAASTAQRSPAPGFTKLARSVVIGCPRSGSGNGPRRSDAQSGQTSPLGRRREEEVLKAAAVAAGAFSLTSLQEQAAALLLALCTLDPRAMREHALGRQYETILQVVMSFLRSQCTRLSSTRVLLQAMSSTITSRRARESTAATAAFAKTTSSSTPSVKAATAAGFSTPSEVRALVSLLEVFAACTSDMLRVHPYYHSQTPHDDAEDGDPAVVGLRASRYYPCLHLISRARFLHTLARLGSTAAVDTLTETASRETGVDVGDTALTIVRRFFALPHFAVEDRVAVLTEANASDVDEDDDEDVVEGRRMSHSNDDEDEDEDEDDDEGGRGTRRAPLLQNNQPLLTLVAQQFRLLDLDARCTLAVRTHVKQRLVRWVRLVFESCPPRAANRHDSPSSPTPQGNEDALADHDEEEEEAGAVADTTLAMAMLKHRGFLEQLTADIERAAGNRSKSPLVSPETSGTGDALESAAVLSSAASTLGVSRRGGNSVAQRRSEDACLNAVAEDELTMLLILLRHLPNEMDADHDGTSGSEHRRRQRDQRDETPLSIAIRRRLVALQINNFTLAMVRAYCGAEVQQPNAPSLLSGRGARGISNCASPSLACLPRRAASSAFTTGTPSAASSRQTRAQARFKPHGSRWSQRDLLLELSVRVLYEWLRRVAGPDEAQDGESARTAVPLHSLHATDGVQRVGISSFASSTTSPAPEATNNINNSISSSSSSPTSAAPRRAAATQVWATTQQDFSGLTDEEVTPFDWIGFPFRDDERPSSSSLATAPWMRLVARHRNSSSTTTTTTTASSTFASTGIHSNTVRPRRFPRHVQPRRPTAGPTMTSIDHQFSTAHEVHTSTRFLLSDGVPLPSSRALEMVTGSTTAAVPGQTRNPEMESINSAIGSRPFPRVVLEAYLEAHEPCLPWPVVKAFRDLLKAGKKKDS